DNRVCIAVLDGPVDLSHPCFAGADLTTLDTLVPNTPSSDLMSKHGTHVASLLFGQAGSPVFGLAPHCRGLIAPVFRDGERLSQLDLSRAIEQAVGAGANIINVSGGEPTPTGEAEGMLAHALQLCEDNGVLVVAAVGNDGCDCVQVPAAVSSTLAVGACGLDGQPLELNNWGEAYRSNAVLAPGLDIGGAVPGGGTATLTGSSFATPVVSGVAALLASVQLLTRDTADLLGVRAAILSTATPCEPSGGPRSHRFPAGRLDVPRAYDVILMGGKTAVDHSDLALAPSEQTPSNSVPAAPTPSTGEVLVAAGSVGAATEEIPCSPGTNAAVPQIQAASVAAPPSSPGPTDPPGPARWSVAEPPGQHPAAVATMAPGVRAACGCGCNGNGNSNSNSQLIYAIGTIGYDFRTEANRDGFRQQMLPFRREGTGADGLPIMDPPNPYDPRHVNRYLAENPWVSDKLTWTLNIARTPIYALEAEASVGMTWEPFRSPIEDKPELHEVVGYPDHLSTILSNFATYPPVSYVYKVFRDAIVGQVQNVDDDNYVSRVAIPGRLTDKTVRLFSGQVVPVAKVSARGLYTWNEAALVRAVINAVNESLEGTDSGTRISDEDNRRNIRAFLDKIYYQFRNLGQSPPDRALNFAGTNAFLFGNEIRDGFLSAQYVPGPNTGLYALDTISVAKSPYCRMDSDCWDVIITFFDPENDQRATVHWQLTIDVSADLPVSLAPSHRFLGR
ncbi:cyanobactin maturation protease, PatA/PatG family, partial [Geodermatophilus obscurus]